MATRIAVDERAPVKACYGPIDWMGGWKTCVWGSLAIVVYIALRLDGRHRRVESRVHEVLPESGLGTADRHRGRHRSLVGLARPDRAATPRREGDVRRGGSPDRRVLGPHIDDQLHPLRHGELLAQPGRQLASDRDPGHGAHPGTHPHVLLVVPGRYHDDGRDVPVRALPAAKGLRA